jgi:hypothetical protein
MAILRVRCGSSVYVQKKWSFSFSCCGFSACSSALTVKRRFAGSRGGMVAVVTEDRIVESNSPVRCGGVEDRNSQRAKLLTSGSLARTLELAGGVVERWRHHTGDYGAVVGSLNRRASRTLLTVLPTLFIALSACNKTSDGIHNLPGLVQLNEGIH